MKYLKGKLPDKLYEKISILKDTINEITLRSGKNAVIKTSNKYVFVDYVTSASEVMEIFQKLCDMSVYAYMDELRSGFVTLGNGNRVGICGTAVIRENRIYNIKNISSLNIRIAHEVKYIADKLNFNIKNLLIISPPACGKTTLLRDICRKIGTSHKISIVDERGEIAASYNGVPAFDVGCMSDVMSLCDKREGIEIVLRSMSPEYIITDEIGEKDCDIIKRAMSYGVNIIATAHGNDINQTLSRTGLDKTMFNNILLLSNRNGVGTIEKMYPGGMMI